MLVYVAPQCRKDADQCHQAEVLDRLVQRLEGSKGYERFLGLFEPVRPYWKRREGKTRVMAVYRTVAIGDSQTPEATIPVICLTRLFQRKDQAYESLMNAPREEGKRLIDAFLPDSAVEAWVANELARRQREELEAARRPPLPEKYHRWLELPTWSSLGSQEGGTLVLEGPEWVTAFQNQAIRDHWRTFYDLLLDLVQGKATEQVISSHPHLRQAGDDRARLLFQRFRTADQPSHDVLLLLAATRGSPLPPVLRAADESAFRPSDPETAPLLSHIAPCARRAYPSLILADEDLWLDIQRDVEANLALSPEEENIFETLTTATPGSGRGLPIFLNGRAGSGKSTLMFYLFADYLHRWETGDLPGRPLFLTYNARLLETAARTVSRILTCHHRFAVEKASSKACPDIRACFHPFREFLQSYLTPDQADHFQADRYLSFREFARRYAATPLPTARQWSPEVAWYVIRTFIKGYQEEGWLTPEEYEQEIPRKSRTVPPEVFRAIHDTIWKEWYLPLTTQQGFWDDQDLVRAVLTSGQARPEFPVVFCDEAQDFTRLELKFILRLSLFSAYDLGRTPLAGLPFAFAGDPFQTLNPTGFRWELVQSMFHEDILRLLDPEGYLRLALNSRELQFNYRSAPALVRFANLVQAWRAALFNHPELFPQECWQRQETVHPSFIPFTADLERSECQELLSQSIIILPCDEHGEIEFIKNDPYLRRLFPEVSADRPARNVLTAMEAKGLEFNRVVLYKFGESCDPAVWQVERGTFEARLHQEFFFNKLYVAATRGREQLCIIDTEEGRRRLWQMALCEEERKTLLARLPEPERWLERTQGLHPGTWMDLRPTHRDEPRRNADQFFHDALQRRNPSTMRKAGQWYREAGDPIRAEICTAWALKFEGQTAAAGRRFMDLQQFEEAKACFWEGRHWLDLLDWAQITQAGQTLEAVFAQFMATTHPDAKATQALLAALHERASRSNGSSLGNPFAPQWRQAVETLTSNLDRFDVSALDRPTWEQAARLLERFQREGFPNTAIAAGECFYKIGAFGEAVRVWEGIRHHHPRVWLARAEVEGFPAGLPHLQKAGAEDRILEEWRKAGGDTIALLTPKDLLSVERLLEAMRTATSPAHRHLLSLLSQEFRLRLADWSGAANPLPFSLEQVTTEINRALQRPDFVWRSAFDELKIREQTRTHWRRFPPAGPPLVILHRLYLEDLFPGLIRSWDGNTSPWHKDWLTATAPILMRHQRYWEAFPQFWQLGLTGPMIECFRKGLPTLPPDCFWVNFQAMIRALYHQNQFLPALRLLEEFADHVTDAERGRWQKLRWRLVEELGAARPLDLSLSNEDRTTLREGLLAWLDPGSCPPELSLETVGRALERVRADDRACRLYEQHFDDHDLELRRLARERYQRFLEHLAAVADTDEQRQAWRDRLSAARARWNDAAAPVADYRTILRELPPGATVTWLPNGILQVTMPPFECRIDLTARVVLILDTASLNSWRLQVETRQLQGFGQIGSRQDPDGTMVFTLDGSGLTVAVGLETPPTVACRLGQAASPFLISFPAAEHEKTTP
ncbi:MAG: hypothetical protein OZSIB_2563 [Candidatus Ozemobacter sibiricus]|uniref:UvrD-like helicase C-terminal domain-containing protein n=1 Tax=Candidatus Ozemobacter sibiricus TaxID=2268124 RepID=A0A367ZT20_9BACT|nr:MAG: hypothetical protein OZSIB_2563 [Candidatus Ozemobacter sibiricus]